MSDNTTICLTGTQAVFFTEEESDLFCRWERLGYSENEAIEKAYAHEDPSHAELMRATSKLPDKPCWLSHKECPFLDEIDNMEYWGYGLYA